MRRVVILLLTAVVLVGSACQWRVAAADRAWDALDLEKVEGARAKADLVKGYLQKYPSTSHTPDAVEAAVYFLTEELDAPREADELLRSVLGAVKDPERRRAVQVERATVLARLGQVDELRAVATEVATGHKLSFPEGFTLAEAAVTAKAWDLALESLAAAEKQTTPEAYRAENPDRTYPDERVQRMVRWRKADVAALTGWALANSGQPAEAMAAFDRGRAFETTLYMGNSGTLLGGYRGRALLLAGRLDEALEVLAPEAVFGSDEDVLAAFKTAYVGKNGSDTGFEDHLWATRVAMARAVDDFELPDYAGTRHRFSELRKGQVTLLAFWFPT